MDKSLFKDGIVKKIIYPYDLHIPESNLEFSSVDLANEKHDKTYTFYYTDDLPDSEFHRALIPLLFNLHGKYLNYKKNQYYTEQCALLEEYLFSYILDIGHPSVLNAFLLKDLTILYDDLIQYLKTVDEPDFKFIDYRLPDEE